jgi:hypothetical protein
MGGSPTWAAGAVRANKSGKRCEIGTIDAGDRWDFNARSSHFLGPDNVPAFSGREGGEEFICAQMIDSLNDKVEFWIRNVAQHVNSFRLPLASGFFYPDFVAKLKDGRTFVVEYKGEHLAVSGNDDTNEKRLVGRCGRRRVPAKVCSQ